MAVIPPLEDRYPQSLRVWALRVRVLQCLCDRALARAPLAQRRIATLLHRPHRVTVR